VKIIHYPHPTLRHKSKSIRRVDADLQAAVAEMFELMYEAKGIGLAANQVDLPYRLFVINLASDPKEPEEEYVFINPVLSHPKGSATAEEGCLSLPGLYADVTRPATIQVSAYGIDGQAFDARVDGLMARAIQHETDHLDGVMFTDKLSETEALAVRPTLEEFEADFDSRRHVGEIGDDAALAANLVELEKKYC
jgi:peptide deformylase